jgi:hypothetical protein
VDQAGGNRQYQLMKVRFRRQFVERWPALASWYDEPLAERVGRLLGEPFHRPSFPVSFRARTYLIYLGLRGYATFDYPWLFAPGQLGIVGPAAALGIDLGTAQLVGDAVALGFNPNSARQAMHWSVSRIALHTGIFDVAAITEDHIAEALQAIRVFADHPDLERFYPSHGQFLDGAGKGWITHLHQLQVVLFHRGQLHTQPRKLMPSTKPPLTLPPAMQAAAGKWLAARRLTDAPSTVDKLELALRVFGDWLVGHHPGITSFADVTRDHCLAWIAHIAEAPSGRPDGKPLGVMSRIQRISGLSQFFRDTAAWQYPDVPGHTLIGAGDAPKYAEKVPRFIPDHELDQLMPLIDALACPFQRAALLVARWSGARRDEIRRLPDRLPGPLPRRHRTAPPVRPQDLQGARRPAARGRRQRPAGGHRPAQGRPRTAVHRRAHRGGDPLPIHEPRQAAVRPLPVREPDPGRLQGRRPGPPRRPRRLRPWHGDRPPLPPHRGHAAG